MAETTPTPHTQVRQFQFRGPTDSADYNQRLEENYADLATLINIARSSENRQIEFYRQALQNQLGLITKLEELKLRVDALEEDENLLTFHAATQVDVDRFASTSYAIPSVSRCSVDQLHGILTLPLVQGSSLSKMYYTNDEGNDVIPSTLETRVLPDATTADGVSAVIDTSDPAFAVVRRASRIWERNVHVSSTNVNGAACTVYYKVPTDLYTTDKSNCIILHPYPAYGPDILDISYTTNPSVLMQDSDGYVSLNNTALHSGNATALGWVPPGGWNGDTALSAPPRIYYFNAATVTGVRIKLRQKKSFLENGKYVYSYGLSLFDLRYDKFLSTGKTILRFDAPSGDTISKITSIQPQIWNLSGAEWPSVFKTKVIWETAFNSGIYTESPVPLSQRVWVEVELLQSAGKTTPALSGITINYT